MRRGKTLKMIEKECSGNILDLGCGTGSVSNYLYDKGFNIEGCDVSKRRLNIAKNKNKNIPYFLFDIDKEILKKKYDTIIMMGILEGIESLPWDILKKLKKSLKKNGKIIFEVPNANAAQKRFRVLFGMDPLDPLYPKVYLFTKKRIMNIIKRSNYKIIRFTTTKFIQLKGINIPMVNSLAQEFFIVIEKS